MNIFLTGATGHTAKYFFQRIIKERSDVKFICPLRKQSNYKKNQLNAYGLNLNFVECDLKGNIEERLSKAKKEISLKNNFDIIIMNDNIGKSKNEILKLVSKFLSE